MVIMGSKAGRYVTADQLREVVTPPPQGSRHMPVPHHEVWDTLTRTLKRRGITYSEPELMLSHTRKAKDGNTYKDTAMFGVMKIREPGHMGNGQTRLLGIRSSNIQVFSIQLIAGVHLTICENGLFSGDTVALKRKHTTNLDLRTSIAGGVDQIHEVCGDFEELLVDMQDKTLHEDDARLAIYGMIEENIMASRFLTNIHDTYFKPKEVWTDCTPRTVWGLYNAITRVLREEPVSRRMRITQGVTDYLTEAFKIAC